MGYRRDLLAAPAGRAGRKGGARRRTARPAGQARGGARLEAPRAPPRRAADVVDGLAGRPRRHGPPRRAGRAEVPTAEAEARRPRRARPRARGGGPLGDRSPAAGGRERVLDARRGAGVSAADGPSVLRAAAPGRRPQWTRAETALAGPDLRRRGLPRRRRRARLR